MHLSIFFSEKRVHDTETKSPCSRHKIKLNCILEIQSVPRSKHYFSVIKTNRLIFGHFLLLQFNDNIGTSVLCDVDWHIYMVSRNEMQGMGKKAIVTKLIVLYRHLPEATKCFLRDSNWWPPEYNSADLPLSRSTFFGIVGELNRNHVEQQYKWLLQWYYTVIISR